MVSDPRGGSDHHFTADPRTVTDPRLTIGAASHTVSPDSTQQNLH